MIITPRRIDSSPCSRKSRRGSRFVVGVAILSDPINRQTYQSAKPPFFGRARWCEEAAVERGGGKEKERGDLEDPQNHPFGTLNKYQTYRISRSAVIRSSAGDPRAGTGVPGSGPEVQGTCPGTPGPVPKSCLISSAYSICDPPTQNASLKTQMKKEQKAFFHSKKLKKFFQYSQLVKRPILPRDYALL